MADRLVSRRLFDNAKVSGTAVSGPQSSAIFLGLDVARLESLTFQASSPSSNPDLAFFYRVSPDNLLWGSYADRAALLTSTVSLANPQGYQTISFPLPLAPWIQFSVSGVASNPQDSVVVFADLLMRLS